MVEFGLELRKHAANFDRFAGVTSNRLTHALLGLFPFSVLFVEQLPLVFILLLLGNPVSPHLLPDDLVVLHLGNPNRAVLLLISVAHVLAGLVATRLYLGVV